MFHLFISVVLLLLVFKLASILKRIEELLEPAEKPATRFLFIVAGKEITNMFLKVTQKLPVSVKPVDAKGNPAKVDGAPQYALAGLEGEIEVAEDGLSAIFTPSGALGVGKIQVKADADLGEGVVEILGELEVEVIAGDAVSIAVTAGEAQDA